MRDEYEDSEENSVKKSIAEEISCKIADMIDNKRVLPSKNRPVEPRDIMVLVRKRDEISHNIIKSLQSRNIPVSGMDRLRIMDHIAIKDLISAANFVLLPEDDLNLCCLLKSPIFGLDDDDLFQICYGRKNTVWNSIKSNNSYKKTTELLKTLLSTADILSPFEFFMFLLEKCEKIKEFRKQMGSEINDPYI